MNLIRFVIGLLYSVVVPAFVVPQSSAEELKDQLGRMVSVPRNPQRIVCLAPSIAEIMFALGQEQRVVGVTAYSDFPPEALDLPKVGSYVHLDLERIVALRPDLCFAIRDGNPRLVAQRLEHLKIPVYAVDPRDLGSVMATLHEMGEILNAEKEAREVVRLMESRIERVRNAISTVSHTPRVFFQIGLSPIVSAGTDTFLHELISLSGGENLAQGPVMYPRLTREQVVALHPDVLIITTMTRGAAFDRIQDDWAAWDHMPAVKNRRIHVVDSDLFDRPSPRLVDALEVLARLIHPESFEEAN